MKEAAQDSDFSIGDEKIREILKNQGFNDEIIREAMKDWEN